MIKPDDPYAAHVSSRLLDFFGDRTRWPRGLWDVGLTLSLREVLEASEAVHNSILSERAFKGLCSATLAKAGSDPGVGEPEEHRSLQQCLSGDLTFLGVNYYRLREMQGIAKARYLTRWIDELGKPEQLRPRAEHAARAIAAHALDAGLNQRFLHRWWTRRAIFAGKPATLGDLVAGLRGLVARPPQEYAVMVAFSAAPAPDSKMPAGWLSPTDVAVWLDQNAGGGQRVRQNGGLIIRVNEANEDAAVERVGEIVDRLAARVAVGTRSTLVPLDVAWIAGRSKSYRLRRTRYVEVLAVRREGRIYSLQEKSTPIDAALELVAPLDEGPPAPAVSGGWAAIEALLVGPGDRTDRGVAADRLASLVACSWPRAELTTLAYNHRDNGKDALAQALVASGTNRERASLVANALRAGASLALTDPSDRAAEWRMRELMSKPREVLGRVEKYVAGSLRRLYRQRNLVLHWGKTDAVALRACLRTVAPLVGAGIDRVAHTTFVDGVSPLDLAARARNHLDLVGTPAGRPLCELLEM